VEIRPFAARDLEPVVRVWHDAKRAAYGFLPQEQARTLADDRAFFAARIAPACALWLAAEGAALRGFLALVGSYVDRLYVAPAAQRTGIGTALLRHAIALSPAGIELHTHQRNAPARAFYAKHGLRAVRFGVSPPPESEPDVEYHWRPAAGSSRSSS
jgi:GNAT superfamily N-acetyltransferase